MNITLKDLEDAYYEGHSCGIKDSLYFVPFKESNIHKKFKDLIDPPVDPDEGVKNYLTERS